MNEAKTLLSKMLIAFQNKTVWQDHGYCSELVEECRGYLREPAWPKTFGHNDLMAVAAFRYCLGRQTYIVSDCADWLIEQWPNFSDNAKAVIKKDLEDAFVVDDDQRERERHDDMQGLFIYSKPLGMDCDRAQWERVRALWHTDNPWYSPAVAGRVD